MTVLESNRIILEQMFPELIKHLTEVEDRGTADLREIQLVYTASGLPSIIFKGKWLHSSRNPQEEAKKFIKALGHNTGVNGSDEYKQDSSHNDKRPLILFGFGLGYTAECIREAWPKNPLIILEPYSSILLKALETRDLSHFLSSPPLIFILDRMIDALPEILSLFDSTPILIAPRPYQEAEQALYRHLVQSISLWETKNKVNIATVRKFGKRWVRNIAANHIHIADTPGIKGIAQAFSNIPALILAAGPSLDGILKFLPDLKERCLIITVDTALRAVLRTGVTPDFVVVVDPQYWNARHLDFCSSPDSCLITETAVYPSIFRQGFKRILLCSSQYPLGIYIENRTDQKGRLGAGGSVATTALDFAVHLGTAPIWIAGLDLAYPDFKTHFSGALFEEQSLIKSNRFITAEIQSFRGLLEGHPFYTTSASGTSVLTDKRLSLYTAWFEGRMRQLSPGRCKSLSPEGIKISGLELGTVEELFKFPVIRPILQKELDAKLTEIAEQFNNPQKRQQREAAYRQALMSLQGETVSLLKISMQGRELAQTMLNEVMGGETKDLDQRLAVLDDINHTISHSPIKDIAGFLFNKQEDSTASDDTRGPLRRYLEYLVLFYTSLTESLDYQIQLFSKTKDF